MSLRCAELDAPSAARGYRWIPGELPARLALSDAERATVGSALAGDLHAGQILLDDTRQLAGVIDWDELAIGDPAFDLVMAYGFLPPSARTAFWSIYGPSAAKARARHLALSLGLALLVQAIETEDTCLGDEAAFSLRSALST